MVRYRRTLSKLRNKRGNKKLMTYKKRMLKGGVDFDDEESYEELTIAVGDARENAALTMRARAERKSLGIEQENSDARTASIQVFTAAKIAYDAALDIGLDAEHAITVGVVAAWAAAKAIEQLYAIL